MLHRKCVHDFDAVGYLESVHEALLYHYAKEKQKKFATEKLWIFWIHAKAPTWSHLISFWLVSNAPEAWSSWKVQEEFEVPTMLRDLVTRCPSCTSSGDGHQNTSCTHACPSYMMILVWHTYIHASC